MLCPISEQRLTLLEKKFAIITRRHKEMPVVFRDMALILFIFAVRGRGFILCVLVIDSKNLLLNPLVIIQPIKYMIIKKKSIIQLQAEDTLMRYNG